MMNPFRGNITGAQVREWRHRHGWTQPVAAGHLKMPLNTYKQREGDHRAVPGVMEVAMAYHDLVHTIAKQAIDKKSRVKHD